MKVSEAFEECSAQQSFVYVYDRTVKSTVYVLDESNTEYLSHPYKVIRVLETNYRHVEIANCETIEDLEKNIGVDMWMSDDWYVDTTYNTEIGMLAAIFTRELDHQVIYNKKDPWDR